MREGKSASEKKGNGNAVDLNNPNGPSSLHGRGQHEDTWALIQLRVLNRVPNIDDAMAGTNPTGMSTTAEVDLPLRFRNRFVTRRFSIWSSKLNRWARGSRRRIVAIECQTISSPIRWLWLLDKRCFAVA
jgi:hypothetical protein